MLHGEYHIIFLFQDGKEKHSAPAIQHNLIRLLADLCVTVNKWEIVDMILPLFIESLEEGDASSPSLLRLRVWNFVFSQCTCFYIDFLSVVIYSYFSFMTNFGL